MKRDNYFVFKGNRSYLHGTTVFDMLTNKQIGPEENPVKIDFIFSKQTKYKCTISPSKQPCKLLIASYTDSKNKYFLYETQEEITDRIEYTDPREDDSFDISNNEASIHSNETKYSFIEVLTSAYKCLLSHLFPESKEKFVLARLMLDHIPESSYKITYKRKISGGFYEAIITETNNCIGHIYFGEK